MAQQEESSRRPRKTNSEGRTFSGSRPERRTDEFRPRRSSEGDSENRPRRSFDKPQGERSFDKPRSSGRSNDRNSDSRPERNFSRGDRNADSPRSERSFDKPRVGGRSFDRSSDRNSDNARGERSFDKSRSGGRSFDRSNDRNADAPRGERSFDKPRSERNFDSKPGFSRGDRRSDAPRGERSFDKPRGERNFDAKPERSFDKPRRDENKDRETPNRYGKRADHDPTRKKGRFQRSDDAENIKTPTYNLDKYKENAPEKIRKKIDKTEKEGRNTTRLNRYIALSGVCSRRDADALIEAGEISVNGKVVKELGYQVKAGEVVRYGRRTLNPEKMVYVLLNKPKDFITTVEDDMDRRTVMELVKAAAGERIYPVGRLDRNTTGLLLLTNDGELAEKLTHPSNQIEKIYQVEINKPITTEDFEAIKNGVELEDGFIKPDEVSIITPDAQVIGIRIHSGRNRIVRRIFEKFGYDVTKLDRTVIAGLNKKELPRGQWRYLTEKEVIRLKYLV
ncbi:pseudouridine synthase [Siphonobacter sp. SORGH_AS_1065]|uniref:pseudouridine synthase n=1 Tax=Siphonobacter sp. SORGH_AS_1065 TaxID=3041795 RepID=UPI00278ACB7D|nr:pseudouridine synthase [Siphonobacter sp. SORGH_AS_1065]MDQ1086562.1 23S rRNA pseudouridine2605 synthase [Siphonobacter sp. SORGH_AS_1065]